MECTPFFKHRIEALAKEGRRVFDAIARRWDPVTVDDLKKELRKPSNYISAQIKRLVDEGFIEEASGTEKKKRYQVTERFYNVVVHPPAPARGVNDYLDVMARISGTTDSPAP